MDACIHPYIHTIHTYTHIHTIHTNIHTHIRLGCWTCFSSMLIGMKATCWSNRTAPGKYMCCVHPSIFRMYPHQRLLMYVSLVYWDSSIQREPHEVSIRVSVLVCMHVFRTTGITCVCLHEKRDAFNEQVCACACMHAVFICWVCVYLYLCFYVRMYLMCSCSHFSMFRLTCTSTYYYAMWYFNCDTRNIHTHRSKTLIPIDHGLCLPCVVTPWQGPDRLLLDQLFFIWQVRPHACLLYLLCLWCIYIYTFCDAYTYIHVMHIHTYIFYIHSTHT